MADELVLHFENTNFLLASRSRINTAIGVSGVVLLLGVGGRLVAGDSLAGLYALLVVALAALVLVFLGYARLRFANAGLFLSGGTIGVAGTLGERRGVEVSRVDHLQLCTLDIPSMLPNGVLLVIDREGRSILRLDAAHLISEAGLRELARRAGLPLQGSWDDTYTAAEMARRFPGSVDRATRGSAAVLSHPWRTRLITVGITVLFFVVLTVVLIVRSGR